MEKPEKALTKKLEKLNIVEPEKRFEDSCYRLKPEYFDKIISAIEPSHFQYILKELLKTKPRILSGLSKQEDSEDLIKELAYYVWWSITGLWCNWQIISTLQKEVPIIHDLRYITFFPKVSIEAINKLADEQNLSTVPMTLWFPVVQIDDKKE